MDSEAIKGYVGRLWEDSIVAELSDYIRIPNKSPAFDPQWREHGYMEQAIARMVAWAHRQPISGMQIEVVTLEQRTPLILIDIPGERAGGVLLYGHLDKQPEMGGWREGLGPWQPVIENGRLYGRGAADDGYALFACLTAIGALDAQRIAHARCVILIEACEESGSYDLPAYIDHLASRIGEPSLVVGLDSGCGNYDQLWATTSLRGLAGGTLRVEVLSEGVHSGDAGGVVPDSFRIARQLLSRIEDETTGQVLGDEFYVTIPEARVQQAASTAAVLGDSIRAKFPFTAGTRPLSADLTELVLNRTWRPALAMVGADGLPPTGNAGNVLRPMTALKLSLRLPPTCDPDAAVAKLRKVLEQDPPSGARVSFEPNWAARGWNAPATARWLKRSLDEVSRTYFGKPVAYMGEGGTIPFMSMLGERFPRAQFLITGVLGPGSNAHGPNEFLDLTAARKLSCCVAGVLADHRRREAD